MNEEHNNPACLDFRLDRYSVWLGYCFFSKCAQHKKEISLGNHRAKRSSRRFRCAAGHLSLNVPHTIKQKKWLRDSLVNDNNRMDEGTIEDDIIENNNAIVE